MADENAPLLVGDENQKVYSGANATRSRSKASDGLLVGMLSCIGFLNVRMFLPKVVMSIPWLTSEIDFHLAIHNSSSAFNQSILWDPPRPAAINYVHFQHIFRLSDPFLGPFGRYIRTKNGLPHRNRSIYCGFCPPALLAE